MNYDYSQIEIAEGGPGIAVSCRVDGCSFSRILDDEIRLTVVLELVQEHIESEHDELLLVTLDDIDQVGRRAEAERWRRLGPIGGGGGGAGILPMKCNICGWRHAFGTPCVVPISSGGVVISP